MHCRDPGSNFSSKACWSESGKGAVPFRTFLRRNYRMLAPTAPNDENFRRGAISVADVCRGNLERKRATASPSALLASKKKLSRNQASPSQTLRGKNPRRRSFLTSDSRCRADLRFAAMPSFAAHKRAGTGFLTLLIHWVPLVSRGPVSKNGGRVL